MFTLTETEDSKVFTFKAGGRKFVLTQHTKNVAEVSPVSVKKGLRVAKLHIITSGKEPTVIMCDFPCTPEEAINASKTSIEGFRAFQFADIEKAMNFAVCMLKG